MKITLINHASCIFEFGSYKLLCDPWFEGFIFGGGWGLQYESKKCYELVKNSTHLWVSHFHEDHLNRKTLIKILEINPELIIFANDSCNFQMSKFFKSINSKNIISLDERKEYLLSNNSSIKRYPATGIDNALLIKHCGYNYLNLNDVVLSKVALKALAKEMGPIEIIMSNFNHAGKILKSSINKNKIRKSLIENYQNNIEPFNAKYSIPFASYHYYRAPESSEQNSAMIGMDELQSLGNSVIPIKLGERVSYNPLNKEFKIKTLIDVPKSNKETIKRSNKIEFEELIILSKNYLSKVNKSFLYLPAFFKSLIINIYDLGLVIKLSFKQNKILLLKEQDSHINMHSSVLKKWLSSLYGTDQTCVGAHFSIGKLGRGPLLKYITFCMLFDNKLDLVRLLKMLFTYKGLKFFFNRREEIIGLIFSRSFIADYQKEID